MPYAFEIAIQVPVMTACWLHYDRHLEGSNMVRKMWHPHEPETADSSRLLQGVLPALGALRTPSKSWHWWNSPIQNTYILLFPASGKPWASLKPTGTSATRLGMRESPTMRSKNVSWAPAANTKIDLSRIPIVCKWGGNKKYWALRLDLGKFSWGSECCTH